MEAEKRLISKHEQGGKCTRKDTFVVPWRRQEKKRDIWVRILEDPRTGLERGRLEKGVGSVQSLNHLHKKLKRSVWWRLRE